MRYVCSERAVFGLWFLAAPAALLLLLAVIFHGTATVSGAPDAQVARAAAFLASCGWSLDAGSCETAEVDIPERFNAVYEGYNDLQRSQGFDLTPYRGRRLRRVSFTVTNCPGNGGDGLVRANVFLDGLTVVAADLCAVAADGFIRGVTPEG